MNAITATIKTAIPAEEIFFFIFFIKDFEKKKVVMTERAR